MLNKNEIKKELYKSKVMANFSHYCSGNLYYKVELIDGIYQFPIATIEKDEEASADADFEINTLSSDLGTTSFNSEIRASELNRWIDKAINNETFILLKQKTHEN